MGNAGKAKARCVVGVVACGGGGMCVVGAGGKKGGEVGKGSTVRARARGHKGRAGQCGVGVGAKGE